MKKKDFLKNGLFCHKENKNLKTRKNKDIKRAQKEEEIFFIFLKHKQHIIKNQPTHNKAKNAS